MIIDNKGVDLAAPKRRSVVGLLAKIIDPSGGDLKTAGTLGYTVVTGWIGQLASIGGMLPINKLRSAQKARYRRLETIADDLVSRMVIQGLESTPAGMLPGAPDPQAMTTNVQTRAALRGPRSRAATGMKWADNLRGLGGVYAHMQLSLVYNHVQGVIDDPSTPPATREAYLRSFATLLAHKDDLAQAVADGKDQALAQRQQSEEEAAQLRDELLVSDVAAAVDNSWPVDQTRLTQAGAAYARIKARAAATTAAAATAAAAAVTPAQDTRKTAR